MPPSHNFAASTGRPKYINAFSFRGLRPLTLTRGFSIGNHVSRTHETPILCRIRSSLVKYWVPVAVLRWGQGSTAPPNLAQAPQIFSGLTCLHQFILYCTVLLFFINSH